MIEFINVSKRYDKDNLALDNVSLKVDKGEFVFVLGASGAGKSTLLKLILREERLSSGKIIVNGKDVGRLKRKEIPYYRRGLGVVFQDFRLIDSMNVYDNIAFALRVINAPPSYIQKQVPYVMELLELTAFAKRYPEQLSGGEQQRVALARAIVNNPALIIADEPTGNVDPGMSEEIVELLTEINNCGTTVLMVTHEHSLVSKFRHRTIILKDGALVADTSEGARHAL